MIALKASGPSLGGLATGVSPGTNSVETEGRSAGRIALRIASSRIPSDQNGFQFAGPSTVGGPEGKAMTPADAGTSSIARIPALSGVFSENSFFAHGALRQPTKIREPSKAQVSAMLGS